jgi:hypothetical protein
MNSWFGSESWEEASPAAAAEGAACWKVWLQPKAATAGSCSCHLDKSSLPITCG